MNFKIGDEVRITSIPQPDIGEVKWVESMNKFCGKIGTIISIDSDGNCAVSVPEYVAYWYNPKWLTKVSPSNSKSNKLLLLQIWR